MPPTAVFSEHPHHPTPRAHGPTLTDWLTAGYARVYEFEAERASLGNRIDHLLASGAPDADVFALVRRQRALGGRIAALRADLAAARPRP